MSRLPWLLTEFVLTCLTLFYFLRDRRGLLRLLRRLLLLSAPDTSDLFNRIGKTVRASLYGNLVVKLAQGFLGGLMFWILGLPSPVLFGAAMAIAATLPLVGTGLIWVPGAVYLGLNGSWIKAVVLLIWGGLVVGLIDNFLFPALVADELRIHPLAVLFSTFGGLLAFGFTGVVLGPVVLAIVVAVLDPLTGESPKAVAGVACDST